MVHACERNDGGPVAHQSRIDIGIGLAGFEVGLICDIPLAAFNAASDLNESWTTFSWPFVIEEGVRVSARETHVNAGLGFHSQIQARLFE